VPHRVWPLGALALAVLLVGCGSDDEGVVSRPFVDPQQYPNGIDGKNGIQITGGYTVAEANNLSDRINSGG
jgi:hypothetical protein